MAYTSLETPLGYLKIRGDKNGIRYIKFVEKEEAEQFQKTPRILSACKRQLKEYFSDKRKSFDLQLNPSGTELQKKIWKELCTIPKGTTVSYQELALRLDKPNLARVIGLANAKNPLAIVVPCHRVIGKNGTLTGYIGGLWRKQKLLEFEGANIQMRLFVEE